MGKRAKKIGKRSGGGGEGEGARSPPPPPQPQYPLYLFRLVKYPLFGLFPTKEPGSRLLQYKLCIIVMVWWRPGGHVVHSGQTQHAHAMQYDQIFRRQIIEKLKRKQFFPGWAGTTVITRSIAQRKFKVLA